MNAEAKFSHEGDGPDPGRSGRSSRQATAKNPFPPNDGVNRATARNPVAPQTVVFQDVPYDLAEVEFVCAWRPAKKGDYYLHTDRSGRDVHVMAQMARDDNNGIIRPIIVGLASKSKGWLIYLEDMDPIQTSTPKTFQGETKT